MKNEAKLLAGLVSAFLLMSSFGCAEKEQEDKPPVSLTVEPLVGIGDVKAVAVCRTVHGDSLDTHLAARLDDPECDLTAIGDQYLLVHQ